MTAEVCWLLLHGTPLTPVVWDQVAAQLRPHAPTQIPAVIPAGEVADVQRALAQQVLGQLVERPYDIHVVGHSFGGQVALDIALAAPERVRSLTMICSRDTPYPPFAAAAAALRRGDAVDINAAMSRWFRPEELQAEGPVVGTPAIACAMPTGAAGPTPWRGSLTTTGRCLSPALTYLSP